jgi:hypothetical protein
MARRRCTAEEGQNLSPIHDCLASSRIRQFFLQQLLVVRKLRLKITSTVQDADDL